MQGVERPFATAGRILLRLSVLTALCACHQEPAAERLDPRSPTRRLTLPPGETQSFELVLESGQYLQLLVEQLGVDLIVTLSDPGGRTLLEIDNPSGADGSQGPERVVWVAEVPGSHDVTVRGRGGQGGDYEITVEALRTPDDADRRRAAAERSMARGDVFYGERESRRRSVDAYEEARAGFRILGDRAREADALYRLGRSWYSLQERPKALARYGEALRLYEETGAARQLAITLHNLCAGENFLREVEKAFEHCSRALPLWEQVNDLLGKAKSSNELGLTHRLWGENRKALAYYDQALALRPRLGRTSFEATALHNRGRVYLFLGERQQAQADLEESLRLRTALGNLADRVVSLNSLGQLHRKWQEMDRAAELFQQALDLQSDDSGYRRGISLLGLGRVHGESGEDERAHELFQEALEIFRREGLLDWQARASLDLGWLYESRTRTREAAASFARAQTLFRNVRDLSSEAEAILGLATVARLEGELGVARERIEMALGMIEDIRIRATASSDLRADFVAIRQRYDEFYVDLLMEMGRDAEALAASERGRARSLLEMLNESPGDLDRGVDPRLVALRCDLERRINEKEHRLIQLKKRDAAPAVFQQVEDEQRSLLREHEVVEGRIRGDSPRYAALTQPEPLSTAEIQRRALDEDTLLLEYDLGEERSYLWAVTSDSLVSARLPPRSEIEDTARRAYDLIREDGAKSRVRVRTDLARLSRILLEPAMALLKVKKRLLVVGDGVLQYFPFAALPVPGENIEASARVPLVASHEIVSLPSASTLVVLREVVSRERLSGRRPAAGTLAVVADPVFGGDDPRLGSSAQRSAQPVSYPRLVHSAAEAEAILALVPPEKRFEALGFDANGDLVSSGQLSRYRIVHFATHAELNTRRPELSRLVLSLVDRQGRARDDGLLYTYAIYNLDLPAELVVLSACETALGKEVRGEGLIGPPRAFLYAGAARVVVSLWKVDDRSTAELMKRFYVYLLKGALAPGEALRAAQDSIRQERRWRTPYHWAGFVLQGEWNDIDRGVD